MVRLNLQLFAYTGNSIVDYLKSTGKDSSFSARKKLAEQNGIINYTGTASQNTELLNTLRSGSSAKVEKPQTKPANTQTNTPTTTTNNPTFKGADQKYVDKAYEEYKPSEKETEYATKRDEYVQGVEDKINAGPQFSETVTNAFTYIDGALGYFQNGKTFWDDKIFGQADAIANREKFVYDVDNDPLFQQALASAMNSGKTAMQDTIGQASSLTGGYSSTFATSAGNQAYNSFIEDAYNNLPQYYQMALSAYEAEGQEMYNLLNMYTQLGEQEWGRHVDAYNTTLDFANSQRDFEYGLYQDEITNLTGLAGTYDSMYQGEQTKNMTLWQQSIENAWKTVDTQIGEYQFGIQQDQWDKEFGLQEKQYKLSTGDTNGDGVLSDAEKAEMNTNYSYDSNGNVVKGVSGTSDFKLTDTEITNIKKIYDENGGGQEGEEAVAKYLEQKGHNPTSEQYESIVAPIFNGSNDGGSSSGKVTSGTVEGFRTTEGDNFKVTVGDKTYKVENKGKVTDENTIKALQKVGGETGNVILYNGDAYVNHAGGYYKIGATNGLFNFGETKGYSNLLGAL